MNIIKLQNMLRGVPDEALIGYVQNPQGEVPSYLALSELQRRKDTREKYQAEQAPESSVAEDLEQETMSDQGGLAMLAKNPDLSPGAPMSQGVADLPVDDDMYQEDSFASGGIVAFDRGGGVKYDDGSIGYPFGGYVAPAIMATGRAASKYGLKGLRYAKDKLLGTPKVTGPTMNLPTGPVTPVLEAGTRGLLKTPGAYLDTAVIGGVLYGIDQYGNKQRITEEEAAKVAMQKIEEENLKSMEDHTKAREAREAKEKEKAKLLKDIEAQNKGTETQTQQTTQQPADSYEDALRKRMAVYKEFMGPNEDRDKLNKKIEAMEARAARQEEMAPWMALTEAGFKTMQGTSPFALANLGAGAQAGLQSYATAQDRMAALEEKRYALMNEAAKADRAERQAAVAFGENSYQHQAALEQRERLGLAELDVKREANRLTKELNTARIGALTTGRNTKAMAELIQKENASINKKLATLLMGKNKSKEVQDMIKILQEEKRANELKIRAMFEQDGLAGVQTSAINDSGWGDLQVN